MHTLIYSWCRWARRHSCRDIDHDISRQRVSAAGTQFIQNPVSTRSKTTDPVFSMRNSRHDWVELLLNSRSIHTEEFDGVQKVFISRLYWNIDYSLTFGLWEGARKKIR